MFEQVLQALKIEIPQLITHVIGFLLALWVLKRYAWKPILALLEERREKIKSSFDEIDEKNREAEALNVDYQAKLKDIDSEARKRLAEAVKDGQKIAATIKDDARKEAKEILARTKTELEQDVAKARVELKEEMIAMTLTATERIIKEKLDEQKHREMISRFIDEAGKAA